MGPIVVVGGAGGIGSAIVERYLGTAGDTPVVVADTDERRGTELVKDLGDSVQFYSVDVRDESDVHSFGEAVEDDYGTVSHLVSLAGFALDSEFDGLAGIDPDDVESSIDLNLTSHVRLLKGFQPLLVADSAEDRSAVLVSSINAIQDYGLPSYSAAKAGMLGLANATVSELGADGVRINTVLPGTVASRRGRDEPKHHATLEQAAALERLATPRDVADAVFALTHVTRAVTGAQLIVDCGQTTAGTEYIDR